MVIIKGFAKFSCLVLTLLVLSIPVLSCFGQSDAKIILANLKQDLELINREVTSLRTEVEMLRRENAQLRVAIDQTNRTNKLVNKTASFWNFKIECSLWSWLLSRVKRAVEPIRKK